MRARSISSAWASRRNRAWSSSGRWTLPGPSVRFPTRSSAQPRHEAIAQRSRARRQRTTLWVPGCIAPRGQWAACGPGLERVPSHGDRGRRAGRILWVGPAKFFSVSNELPLRMIDLFAGCGGMTRGFVDAGGFKPVAAVEKELQPAATYAANFGQKHIIHGDIADYLDVAKADLVVGGPPCQGFSNLGKKDPADLRNKLWSEFVRVVVDSEAQVFVFENVERFSRSAEFELLRGETARGGKLKDFHVQLYTLNAADFGVPQKRLRSIIVGSRIGMPAPPKHTHDRVRGNGLKPWRTVRSAIGRLDWHVKDEPLPDDHRNFSGKRVGGAYSLAQIHVSRWYAPESIARFQCIPPGGNRFDLPFVLQTPGWQKHLTGAGDVMGRLKWDEPSVTIRTEFHKPEKGRYLHPQWVQDGEQVNRALTLAEGALLQGFTAKHKWCGSKVGIAKQIGNAVPPPMAKAIALTVKELFVDAASRS